MDGARYDARVIGKEPDRSYRIAVLISGTGTGLQNLIDRIREGRLPHVTIAVVITSRVDAPGLQRAREAGLPVEILRVKDFPDSASFSMAIEQCLRRFDVDLAVMAGWLCFWRLSDRWLGRVINIHPALLPRHGGKGCYGRRVHEAVLAAGDKESGVTVHWVDNEYDHGEIIEQRSCALLPGDTPESLAARVAKIEHELLPDVIHRLAARTMSE